MKIDISSFFFNSRIEGKTATPAWGTSIGQKKSKDCKIETEKSGINELLIGMLYKAISDTSRLDISGGSSQSELCLASVFDKVFVNGKLIPSCSFGLLLLRESTKSHNGRRRIAYPPYLKLDGISINQNTIDKIPEVLGFSSNGCWFIYDISVKNQDELHFSVQIVNTEHEMIYHGESKDRSQEWRSLISTQGNLSACIAFKPLSPLQKIFYGAPGTGKSHQTDKLVEGDKQNKIHQRTTFHPDSDYSSFVGCYKPSKENGELTYKFVPQAFLKAYVAAWKNPGQPYYLIIEEINRGNCAQIFGDIFQLLDRREDGFSKYHITSDTDIAAYLRDEAFADVSADELPVVAEIDSGQILCGEIMQLPSNLHIYATMNTSDQSLFPIDSAFKRRWEWEYKPIEQPDDIEFRDWKIVTDDNVAYDWWDFLSKVNGRIFDTTQSEDKKMGYWFTKADARKRISQKKFISKVLFYLWNDVFRDYARTENTIFKVFKDDEEKETEEYTFTDFFRSEGVTERIHRLMSSLGVAHEKSNESSTNPNDGESSSQPRLDITVTNQKVSLRKAFFEITRQKISKDPTMQYRDIVAAAENSGFPQRQFDTLFLKDEDAPNWRKSHKNDTGIERRYLFTEPLVTGDNITFYITGQGWVNKPELTQPLIKYADNLGIHIDIKNEVTD